MKFDLSVEQRDFSLGLDRLLSESDTVGANRAWADGDTGPGRQVWRRLADLGVHALLVPEDHQGLGATCTEMVLALQQIGRHVVPGPWIESVAYAPLALAGDPLDELASAAMATLSAPPHTPYACDGDVADLVFHVEGETLHLAQPSTRVPSLDRSRLLCTVTPGVPVGSRDLAAAFDVAALACAAQLWGAGERALDEAVRYVKQRRQFGREIGSYQAVKHQLADVRIGLDFAGPLIHGAALSHGTDTFSRDVSAAAAYAADSAYAASRVALQVHGGIGYTAECDLSLWLTRIRALCTAWGTPAFHRRRVLDLVTS